MAQGGRAIRAVIDTILAKEGRERWAVEKKVLEAQMIWCIWLCLEASPRETNSPTALRDSRVCIG